MSVAYPRASQLNLGAFGRLRVADPHTLFDSKFLYEINAARWVTSLVGTGNVAHQANRASALLSTSGSGTAILQTRIRYLYQPGKSQLVYATGVLGAGVSGTVKQVGLFDDENGLFFEQNGTNGMRVVRRSNITGTPADTAVAQASWDDPMDGTGPSGKTLDVTKAQIFVIDFEWLGVGTVRFGFVIDGLLYYVHTMKHANVLDSVYMSIPNLPIRYAISASSASSMEAICSTVISEGGRDLTGVSRSAPRTTALSISANDTLYPVAAMRLKSTHKGSIVSPVSGWVYEAGNDFFIWRLHLNPAITGTPFSFTSVANSPVEVDLLRTNATTITGDGILLASGGSASATESEALPSSEVQLGQDVAGNRDIVVLSISRKSGSGAESYYGGLSWREVI